MTYPCVRKACCVAAVSGRHDAVEEVDPGGDGVEDVLRPADAHQVARPVRRQEVGRHLERLADLLAALADADAADRVAVEVDARSGPRRTRRGGRRALPPARSRRGPDRPACGPPCSAAAQSIVRRDGLGDRLLSRPAAAGSGPGTWPRRPRASSWIAMARSGVSSSSRPSRCDRNVTPVVGHPAAVGQAEDLEPARVGEDRPVPAHERVQAPRAPPPRPHRAAGPGDRCWPAASACPVARSWSGVSPLTVAWVPTGMNAGVSTEPCGVSSSPSRRRARSGST